MIVTLYWLVFVVAFMGCVLATPFVTRIASWAGAIDRPDQFRRVHAGAVPRMGGLGMAAGVLAAVLMALRREDVQTWFEFAKWSNQLLTVLAASLLVLAVGIIDDSRGMGPRAKLVGQAVAVLILYMGGIRIDKLTLLGLTMDFTPFNWEVALGSAHFAIGIPGLIVTMLWFLGCMNVWNLIDGMDGLASGVGFLVSFTLMLVAIHLENTGAAVLAAALAGSLFGFLLYNWHPACIFLGDSGSLLIGLLIGVIGVQGSMKGSATVSILFPLLAMGLPISDTAMAIFRRWVRNLPLSLADRRHVHHLLMGLGLNPRQASFLLYIFSGFLCGVVLLGVTFNNEFLALGLGASGVIAFLLILTSRRDELDHLRADFFARMTRGRQERAAARVTFETIQRIELCKDDQNVWSLMLESADKFGYARLSLVCRAGDRLIFEADSPTDAPASLTASSAQLVADAATATPSLSNPRAAAQEAMTPMAGPNLVFRLSLRRDFAVLVRAYQKESPGLASDIAYRFLQRLAEAGSSRLAELNGFDWGCEPNSDSESGFGPQARSQEATAAPQTPAAFAGNEAGIANSPLGMGIVVAAEAVLSSDIAEPVSPADPVASSSPLPSGPQARSRVWDDVWGGAWSLAARSLRFKLRLRQAASRAVHELK